MSLYLASGSPRRRELLQQIGVRFEVIPTSVNEDREPGEAASDYVRRLALAKAIAGRNAALRQQNWPVLGADTAVVINGEILGKPADRQEARGMLNKLSGCTHQVWTGVALVQQEHERCLAVMTEVTFRQLQPELIEAYWDTGEPQDKAGAYAIQGLGAVMISSINGSYSGVVGLPLAETASLLSEFNVPIWQQ